VQLGAELLGALLNQSKLCGLYFDFLLVGHSKKRAEGF
jgi:hypothetical protein